MTINVGIIGVGMIGQDHIRRLTQVLPGAAVVAVTDVNAEQAERVAAGVPGAKVFATGQELIAHDGVDAIVVCSWGPTHEEYVLAAIDAGKPVFCEKPLATTQEACLRIIDAEVAFGRRLVQVGYMRRYDAAYRAMKDVVDSGEIGSPLLMYSGHRNPEVPAHYTREMAITDTAVHDIDTARWLLGEEIVSAQVLKPRKNSLGGDLEDPLLTSWRPSGALIQSRPTSTSATDTTSAGDRRRARLRQPGRVHPGDRPARRVVHRPGHPGLAGAVHQRLRHRFAEWLEAIATGGAVRSQLVGRLRGRRGDRRRGAGPAQRSAGQRDDARQTGAVRRGLTDNHRPTTTIDRKTWQRSG